MATANYIFTYSKGVLEENPIFYREGLEVNDLGSKNCVKTYRYGFNGQECDDEIYGDYGNDVLHGDGGIDTLTGGNGTDKFVFTLLDNYDVITDFECTAIWYFGHAQNPRASYGHWRSGCYPSDDVFGTVI